MKKNIRNILLSGALLAISAQAAQKATIGFPFRTPSGEMPAGRYSVESQYLGTGKYVHLRNLETGRSVLFHASSPVTNTRGTEQPRLIFACAESGCNLQRIWENGVNGLDFPRKSLTPVENERLAVVRITDEAGE